MARVCVCVRGTAKARQRFSFLVRPTLSPHSTRDAPRYLTSVAVAATETIKLALCAVMHAGSAARAACARGLPAAAEARHQLKEVLGRSRPMAVPAALFVVQQVLVFVAAAHLDAVTFQICAQSFKIVPTALFAVWLLGQALTPAQWASLPVLAVGTIFVTLNGGRPGAANAAAAAAATAAAATRPAHVAVGLTASALSGLSSAYAGVYFEKYVKGARAQSLWVRNLQLSLYGAPLAVAYATLADGPSILGPSARGAFQGFDSLVWCVIALQVGGGLVVGLVVKYADNIQKNFANALSVVLTVVGAAPLFGLWPSPWFLVGIGAVLLSVSMYSGTAPPPPPALVAATNLLLKRAPWLSAAGRDIVLALALDRGGLGGGRTHSVPREARAASRRRVGLATLAAASVAGLWLVATGGAGGGDGGAFGRRGMPGGGSVRAVDGDGSTGGRATSDWDPWDPASVERVRPGDADGDVGGGRRHPLDGGGSEGDALGVAWGERRARPAAKKGD